MTVVDRTPRVALGLRLPTIAPIALFLGAALLRLTLQARRAGALRLEDDAYYYTVVADHIARTGMSSFDGQALTNGYHPLWLLLLVAQDLTVGAAPAVTIALELVLASVGLWGILAAFRSASLLLRTGFAILCTVLLWPMLAKGMEVSLFVGLFGLFVREAAARRGGRERGPVLALLAILCIGARIDAAVFILPTLLLVLGSARRAALPLALVALAGAVYAGFNLWMFGLAFPVSGAVKSLGGMQLNHALVRQVAGFWHGRGAVAGAFAFANSFVGRPLLLFVLVAAATPLSRPGDKSRPLCLGFLAGFLLFALKLVAFSSWVVWPWYGFPSIIGLAALFHVIDDRLPRAGLQRRGALAATLLGAVLLPAFETRQGLTERDQSFEPVNRKAVAAFGPVLAGARVAMGDRAGSFAAVYPGPVTQLEGLVNDKAWLEALRRGADLRPILCRRGVRFVLAYQRDLGDYSSVTIPAQRPSLTSQPSPGLTVARADEIGHVSDLAHYDNSAQDEGDNYLYAWRLTGCPGQD